MIKCLGPILVSKCSRHEFLLTKSSHLPKKFRSHQMELRMYNNSSYMLVYTPWLIDKKQKIHVLQKPILSLNQKLYQRVISVIFHYVFRDLNWSSLLLLLPEHQIPTYTFTPTTSKASCNPGYWWSYCYGRCFHGKWPFSNFKHLINSIQCFHLRKMTLFSLLLITTCLEVRMRHLCIK